MTTVETIIFCVISVIYSAVFILLIARDYINSKKIDKLVDDVRALEESVESVCDTSESNTLSIEGLEGDIDTIKQHLIAAETKKTKKKTKVEESA